MPHWWPRAGTHRCDGDDAQNAAPPAKFFKRGDGGGALYAAPPHSWPTWSRGAGTVGQGAQRLVRASEVMTNQPRDLFPVERKPIIDLRSFSLSIGNNVINSTLGARPDSSRRLAGRRVIGGAGRKRRAGRHHDDRERTVRLKDQTIADVGLGLVARSARPAMNLVDPTSHSAPTSDGGDDFVWIGGPGEGSWTAVGLREEAVDGCRPGGIASRGLERPWGFQKLKACGQGDLLR
jgi:hypothetical protein